jgi:hypothetical protein
MRSTPTAHFRNYPLTGHAADMAQPTPLTRSRHSTRRESSVQQDPGQSQLGSLGRLSSRGLEPQRVQKPEGDSLEIVDEPTRTPFTGDALVIGVLSWIREGAMQG